MGGRIFAKLLLLFAALGIAVTPAHGKDRKSGAGRDREALVEMLTARQAVQASMSSGGGETSSGRNGKPIAPLAEQAPAESNPFRFNVGAVAIQPTVGGIKGARFSIGF